MVEKKIISLIIPVYNKVKFLRRCLDSVASQFTPATQIILVDDGSTDGSKSICAEYSRAYKWEYYQIDHQGVSAARNYGMYMAKGEYIAFLDADDVLAVGAIKNMLRMARQGQNIYQFGHYRCRNYKDFSYELQMPYRAPEGPYSFNYIPKYWVVVWNKLYKASFIREHNIKFMLGMQFGEDTVFNMECILANGGFYYSRYSTVVHCIDDNNSLCRGDLKREQLLKLDQEMCDIEAAQSEPDKIKWCETAINEHRGSKLYRKMGASMGKKDKYDVVYLVKEAPINEELVYSLRSLEENWQYNKVWFYGYKPDGLIPDKYGKYNQVGLNKWDKVRKMLYAICVDERVTEDFWLFNDDFFVLKPLTTKENLYNGKLMAYIERVERKIGGPDGYTCRLRETAAALEKAGLDTLNYEVHKPMLLNRHKLLEILEKFPDIPGFRSLYGNYWEIGGVNCHDMKIKILNFNNMYAVENFWNFVSTSDESFRDGEVGRFIRCRFNKKSRFERS